MWVAVANHNFKRVKIQMNKFSGLRVIAVSALDVLGQHGGSTGYLCQGSEVISNRFLDCCVLRNIICNM